MSSLPNPTTGQPPAFDLGELHRLLDLVSPTRRYGMRYPPTIAEDLAVSAIVLRLDKLRAAVGEEWRHLPESIRRAWTDLAHLTTSPTRPL